MSDLKARITEDMKTAMKGGDKPRLGVIRLILAALKQREVDERIVLDDTQVLHTLEKMLKQRRDSITQYEAAQREDLAAQERYEIGVIETYLPKQLGDAELGALIAQCIGDAGATSTRDMGKVMALLRERAAGRADMGALSQRVKAKLAG
ncbi:MAG: GatB/YqeY domain-containing protein [Xanthomonadaceae bacterium]|nr:GatB/YqeY domain-containing protein [Xanthomonadaceae bacterium]MDE2498294.1 GatB/YqeY domain-containing protein [Xanthomonadaceae bacterium]